MRNSGIAQSIIFNKTTIGLNLFPPHTNSISSRKKNYTYIKHWAYRSVHKRSPNWEHNSRKPCRPFSIVESRDSMLACIRRLTAFRLRILWRYPRLYSLPCLLSSCLRRSRGALSDGFVGPIWMFHCQLWARERRLCRTFDAIQPKKFEFKVYKKCGL